jgi:hypothetical protein
MAAAGSSSPGLDEDEVGEAEGGPNDVSGMTLKDILTSMRGRKRTGVPMPSTLLRLEERRKRRKADRTRESADTDAGGPGDCLSNVAAGVEGSGPVDGAAAGGEGAGACSGEPDAVASVGDEENSRSGGDGAEGDDDDGTPLAEPVVLAPKVTIDEDGNIVIDKESLVVSAGCLPAADVDHGEVVTIDKNDVTRHITSASFAKRDSSTKWTPQENDKFFDALSRFGTDFALIEHAFPTRSRRQIKLKFKREERDNPAKVDLHLTARKRMNIADTRKTFGFAGDAPLPVPLSVPGGAAAPDGAESGEGIARGLPGPGAEGAGDGHGSAGAPDDDKDEDGRSGSDSDSGSDDDDPNDTNAGQADVHVSAAAAVAASTAAAIAAASAAGPAANLHAADALDEDEEGDVHNY